jgi:hypothetical protein
MNIFFKILGSITFSLGRLFKFIDDNKLLIFIVLLFIILYLLGQKYIGPPYFP